MKEKKLLIVLSVLGVLFISCMAYVSFLARQQDDTMNDSMAKQEKISVVNGKKPVEHGELAASDTIEPTADEKESEPLYSFKRVNYEKYNKLENKLLGWDEDGKASKKKNKKKQTKKQKEQLKKKMDALIQGNICRLFDEDAIICPAEEDNADTLGRIWALYGKPDNPKWFEDFWHYTILAKNGEDAFYLELYQYSGMPSIGGPTSGIYKEKAEIAAKQLSEKILSTLPVDYEWNGTYEDYGIRMKYYVKNGQAGYEDTLSEALEKYFEKLEKAEGENDKQ